VTTNVEAPRLAAELLPPGFEIRAVSWWDPRFLVEGVEAALGVPAGRLGSDGHPAFGIDIDNTLTRLRLELGQVEQQQLRELGRDAAWSVECALQDWVPGELDYAVQARVAARLESTGADAPVLFVGGDDRVTAWRHPVAVGVAIEHLAMTVLVARRHGLHVAMTRYASAGPVPEPFALSLEGARRIHRQVLTASRPGETYGATLMALDEGYAEEGFPDGWQAHYQGGPIGFGQREFEIAPCQDASLWWDVPIPQFSAIAWNPSLPGGGKDEDTYLLGPAGPELVTTREGSGEWPSADGDLPWRPGILQRRA
jgi:antitoxin VapB